MECKKEMSNFFISQFAVAQGEEIKLIEHLLFHGMV